jgi:hypothetical protein
MQHPPKACEKIDSTESSQQSQNTLMLEGIVLEQAVKELLVARLHKLRGGRVRLQ